MKGTKLRVVEDNVRYENGYKNLNAGIDLLELLFRDYGISN